MRIIFYSLLIVITMILSKKIYDNYISPFSIFLGNFFLAFVIFYSVDFIDQNISLFATIIIVTSIIAFIFGTFIAMLQCKKFIKRGDIYKSLTIVKESGIGINDIKIFRLFFWISLVGYIYFLYIIHTNIGIGRVLKDPVLLNYSYYNKDLSFNSLPLYMMKISMINSMFILVYILKYRCKKISIYVMYFLEIAMNISVKRNTLIYIIALNFFVFTYYNSGKIKSSVNSILKNTKKPTKIAILILVLAVSAYYFSATQKALNKELTTQGTILGIKLPNSIITIITYYVANFKSFDIYLANNIHHIPMLGITFRFLYKILAGFKFVDYDDSFLTLQFVPVPEMFNTTLAQLYIYFEGGFIWVMLFYAFIGYVATLLYFKYLKYRSEITLMYLSLISTILLFSIREYIVILIDFWITILVIIIMQLRCNKRKGEI